MAEIWQTIEQAAVSLRLSVRTINRHMVAGKLQSRLTADGRREVLVSLPDVPAVDVVTTPFSDTPAADASVLTSDPVSDPASPPTNTPFAAPSASADPLPNLDASAFGQAASSAVSLDAERVLALADNAAQKADMAVTAYQTLARVAETQVRQSRRQARVAWAAVALMTFGITGAVGWTTHRLTRAAADSDYLTHEVQQLKDDVTQSAETVRQQSASFETARAAMDASQQALRAEVATAREQAARAEGTLAAYKEQEDARQTRETITAITKPAPEAQASPSSSPTWSSFLTIEPAVARALEFTEAHLPTLRPASPTTARAAAAVSDTSDNAAQPAGARLVSERPSVKSREPRVAMPTTRPTALRPKVATPASRPAAPSDAVHATTDTASDNTSSASTDAGD